MDHKVINNIGASTGQTAPKGDLHEQPECDYDTNPTILYQAIEAKQWDYAASLFTKNKCPGQSGTWVVRKETNGKLRWRLLPLHAAIIFGSPLKLVECLLADYPGAAQCKDDQGMLPLHLAFRNEGTASWEIIEELVTAYPQAIFVKDRKGRTPLQCGVQLATGSVSSSMSVSSAPQQSKTFKSVVGVLDLYSQIVVSGERQRAQLEARKQVEARMAQLQDSQVHALTTLRKESSAQQEEYTVKLQTLMQEKEELLERVKDQDMTIDNLRRTEMDLQAKLESLSFKAHQGTRPTAPATSSLSTSSENATNDVLRSVVQDLILQHNEYHDQFRVLVGKYEELAQERKRIQEIVARDMNSQNSREEAIVESMKQWLQAKEEKIQCHLDCLHNDCSSDKGDNGGDRGSTNDEKKIESIRDFADLSFD